MNGLKFVTIICTVEYVRSGRRNLLLVETTAMYFLRKVATTGKEVPSMNPVEFLTNIQMQTTTRIEKLLEINFENMWSIIPDDNPLKQCLARLSENERHVLV